MIRAPWILPALFLFGALIAVALAAVTAGQAAHGLALAVFFGLMMVLAWIDWRSETVPDVLTLALVASGLAATGIGGGALAVNAGSAALLLAVGAAIGRYTDDDGWVGSGDYFLMAGLAAWLGPLLALEVALLASVAVIAACIATRRRRVALAPALALSAAAIFLGGLIP